MPKLRVTVTAALMAALGAAVFAADNWSRFRGPNGTGVSSATNLPVEFGPLSRALYDFAK